MQLLQFINAWTFSKNADVNDGQNFQEKSIEKLQNNRVISPIYNSKNWQDLGYQFEEFANEYSDESNY